MYHIFVVSDGTGRTAQQALNAALTQFEGAKVIINRRSAVRTKEQVFEIVEEAVNLNAFIVHTLVSDEMRGVLFRTARKHNIETIDLMGPLLIRLSLQFENAPLEKPGLFNQLNKAYFKRIESMEYSFRHDDGLRTHELPKADIVLVGVSRTFKTPLSIYLAFKGWFVANVPIVLGIEPPSILFSVKHERVFGLTTYPNRLSMLRRSRHEHLGGSTGEYADYSYVSRELKYAQSIFNSQPKWTVINVTNKPIEEIASEILSLLGKKDTIN